ncbi:hypothetical protein QWZ08_27055 [Ferruginibacter paludis]|uniref:hypothetical protein n=1 Tax=Ferruginibacter paludis TaxID=1310417 RepID=UPI0025B4AA97|nr:hypothetical protein [Ferruginibacter paludis]MDN3659334.1 hypothetical protein [Ferruginibacter paludis]
MKNLYKALTVFYIVFPLIIVLLMRQAYSQSIFGNWSFLFGIVLYYLSILMVVARQKIILMIPVLFFSWFWLTYGFDLHGFTFFLFICIFSGAFFYQLAQNVKHFIKKVLPENKLAEEYELKIEKMYARLNLYKQKHPTATITPDVIDSIRNDIFFA